MTLAPGARLGPYEIVSPLGAGGMGEVYRARDTRLGREVAIKVLAAEFASDPERLRRFEQEARAVAALNHPNILALHDVGTHAGAPYLVTELLEGQSLGERLRSGPVPIRKAVEIGIRIADGLAAAHEKGIVHRDLKPDNVFVGKDGVVKILDFGIAKLAGQDLGPQAATVAPEPSTETGAVLGTAGYMSPEQVRGGAVDHRTDIFALGCVLYEMLAGRPPFRKDTTAETMAAILRDDPPPLARTGRDVPQPLERIVARCVEKRPEERFGSARDVGFALLAVAEAAPRAAGATPPEEPRPYPGLAAFTEKDAEQFFGREDEVASLWRTIPRRKLLALIGSSGAGKTSFLRAGVVPHAPAGWRCLVATPGQAPFASLARALAPALAGDAEAVRMLLDFESPGVAQALIARWRERSEFALVAVDQFEELFTLSSLEVRLRFAELLGQIAALDGIHVLLSMRDDFLIRTQDHPPLRGVISDLTAVLPLSGDALRRAVVEPAGKLGFAFEDDALVEEMVRAVEGERGALPLLAFTLARLWENRDRERRRLTRAGYESLGGVGGALARHAEATLERIGSDKLPLVRELFRNLVTAEGTRAVRDVDELLTVFAEDRRPDAEAVMRSLVDARLLTSYDVEAAEAGHTEGQRVEVVHESLLTAWPRLVRWRTEDEGSAQLRDQLRQAARLWDEKGRPADLLWSGAVLKEYELWRGRYPGALTALEEQYARAMTDRARRRRVRLRAAAAAIVVALAGVAVTIGVLWRNAVGAARRAEASKLLAIGRERLAADPTEALAYTTASLELEDTWDVRVFALKTLWDAPPAFELPAPGPNANVIMPRFSPDGRILTTGGYMADAHVFREDGGASVTLAGHTGTPFWLTGRLLLFEGGGRASVWSPPGFNLERTANLGPIWKAIAAGPRMVLAYKVAAEGGRPAEVALKSWDGSDAAPADLGRAPITDVSGWGPDGRWWLYARGAALYARPVPVSPGTPDLLLGEHQPAILGIGIPGGPGEHQFVTGSANQARLWTLEPGKPVRVEDVFTPPGVEPPVVTIRDWRWKRVGQTLQLWGRSSWPAARPLVLRRDLPWYAFEAAFHPRGEWVAGATAGYSRLTFWPLRNPRPWVVDGLALSQERPIAFSPDGRWLASSWPQEKIRLWPLAPGAGMPRTLPVPGLQGSPTAMAWDPRGRFVFCVGSSLWIVPIDGRPPVRLDGFARVPWILSAAVSPSGRLAAAAFWTGQGDRTIRVWDLEAGTSRAYDLPQPPLPPGATNANTAPVGGVLSLAFADETTLYSAGWGGVRRWDLASGRHEVVLPPYRDGYVAMSIVPDRGVAVTAGVGDDPDCATVALHDLAGHSARELPRFGPCLRSADLDPSGRVLATCGNDGIIRVGRVSGGEPHILVGHKGGADVRVSPDLAWVASVGEDYTLRLWPMPDLDKPALHALPRAELLAKLRSLTNLRAVRDTKASAGWKIELDPFPGWKYVPTW